MKLYLDEKEVREDEMVNELIEELMTSVESQKATNDLIQRVVQIANSHIWGILITSVQEEESAS